MKFCFAIALVAMSVFSSAVEDPDQGQDVQVKPQVSNKVEDVQSETKSADTAVATASAEARVINNTYITRRRVVMQTLPLKQWKKAFDDARTERDVALARIAANLKGLKDEFRSFKETQAGINKDQASTNQKVDGRLLSLETQAMIRGWYVAPSVVQPGSAAVQPPAAAPVASSPAPQVVPPPVQPAAGTQQAPTTVQAPGGERMDIGFLVLFGIVLAVAVTLIALAMINKPPAPRQAATQLADIGAALANTGGPLDQYNQSVSGFIPLDSGGHLRISQSGDRVNNRPPAPRRPRAAPPAPAPAAPIP